MTPVLLVQGYLCPQSFMRPFRRYLRRRGFDAHLTELSLLCTEDIRELAARLGDNVERVLEETGASRCDLVGVSQGGFSALWYAQSPAGAGKVRRLVAMGTPVRGTWASAAGLPIFGLFSKGIRQVVPGSAFLEQLLAAGIPPGVELTTISMSGDPIAPPDRCVFPGAESIRLKGIPTPMTHQALIVSRAALDAVGDALE